MEAEVALGPFHGEVQILRFSIARRLRYSLRTMLSLIAIVAIAAAIVARDLTLIRAEAVAASLLERAIESEPPEVLRAAACGVCVSQRVPASRWRQALYWFAGSNGETDHVRVVGNASLGVLIEQAPSLRNLRWLEVVPRRSDGEPGVIEREHIRVASQIDSLERLAFRGKFANNVTISDLNRLTRLDTLNVESEEIPAHVIEQLGSIRTLGLNLWCESNDYRFPAAPLASLRSSTVCHISIIGELDDSGLEAVACAPRLRALSVTSSLITDTGIENACPQLHVNHLGISSYNITDKSVEALAQIKELVFLTIDGTTISPAGIARLRQLRPDITINP